MWVRKVLISSSPQCRSLRGESCTIRVIPTETRDIELSQIRLDSGDLATLESWLSMPHGVILVTGPSGSGKTTSLYSMVNHLKCEKKKIVGIEETVMTELQGVTQMKLRPDLGFGYVQALETAPLMACDALYVAELPDPETVNAALQAGSTGCLVLSSCPADGAAEAITQFLQMNCRPHQIASIIGVINQRWVRKVCENCAEEVTRDQLAPAELEILGELELVRILRGNGCEYCNNTGFRHRIASYELLEVNDAIREAIHARASTAEIREVA